MKIGRALLLLLGICTQVYAQDRWNVAIVATTPDLVGQRVVSGLRDKLASSPRYALGNNETDSFFFANVVTLDPANSNAAQSTVYAVTLTLKNINNPSFPLYLTEYVGTCGGARVSECVDNIYSGLDSYFSPFAQQFSERSRAEPPPTNKRQRESKM